MGNQQARPRRIVGTGPRDSTRHAELGETAQLGYYKVMHKIARDIVNMMEEPW